MAVIGAIFAPILVEVVRSLDVIVQILLRNRVLRVRFVMLYAIVKQVRCFIATNLALV